MKRPAFQWYPGDHRRDTGVQVCSFIARAVWREMLDIMHEGDPYGHLAAGGEAIDSEQLSRLIGLEMSQVDTALKELERRKVFSRNDKGIIFCRRMVRDERRRSLHAEAGKMGGNPKLGAEYNHPGYVYVMRRASDGAVKIGISAQPTKRLYRIREQFPAEQITLIAQQFVEDMGASEFALHGEFFRWKDGEWFKLPDEVRLRLVDRLKATGKVKGKGKGGDSPESPDKVSPTPSVAVASSRSKATTPDAVAPERIYAFMGEMRPVWQAAYGGDIPPGTAKRLKPLVDQFGSKDVATRLANYLAATDAQFASIPRFVSTFGTWDSAKKNGSHRADENVKRGYVS